MHRLREHDCTTHTNAVKSCLWVSSFRVLLIPCAQSAALLNHLSWTKQPSMEKHWPANQPLKVGLECKFGSNLDVRLYRICWAMPTQYCMAWGIFGFRQIGARCKLTASVVMRSVLPGSQNGRLTVSCKQQTPVFGRSAAFRVRSSNAITLLES